MNVENLKKLKAWFEEGAPHFYFNMEVPLAKGTPEQMKSVIFDNFEVDIDGALPNTCGSAGCIAGAACTVLSAAPALTIDKTGAAWPRVRDQAMKALGLPLNYGNVLMGHDLFDPELAPRDCTPRQAAQAIQNVIDGRHPWVERE